MIALKEHLGNLKKSASDLTHNPRHPLGLLEDILKSVGYVIVDVGVLGANQVQYQTFRLGEIEQLRFISRAGKYIGTHIKKQVADFVEIALEEEDAVTRYLCKKSADK